MNTQINSWLARRLPTEGGTPSIGQIDDLLKNEMATSFLLVWPIFEQKIFGGYLKHNKNTDDVAKAAQKYSKFFPKIDADDISEHFHDRYQDVSNYRHLRHNEDDPKIKAILDKPYLDLNNEEKMHLVLYVVYRYRNNIFHGNKGIFSWLQFTKQIEYCIQFMMKMIDQVESGKK